MRDRIMLCGDLNLSRTEILWVDGDSNHWAFRPLDDLTKETVRLTWKDSSLVRTKNCEILRKCFCQDYGCGIALLDHVTATISEACRGR